MTRLVFVVGACLALGAGTAAEPWRHEANRGPRRQEGRQGAEDTGDAGRPGRSRLVGWVSDGHCTTEHMKEGGAMCVRKCIAGATHLDPEWTPGGMVFITGDKKVWKVDNPDALWGRESTRVEIAGSLNLEKGSVHVAKLIGPKPAK